MKIIAGKYKGRVVPTVKGSNYRPSTAKFKEALFSILSSGEFAQDNPLLNASVLDLFSGSGSLSFEAVSRGAKTALLVDTNRIHLETAKSFAEKIGESTNIKRLQTNVLHLSYTPFKYNLVFLDPPYYNDMVDKVLRGLIQNNWLAQGAIIAIEMEKAKTIKGYDSLTVLKEKIYGNSKLLILKHI